MTEFAVHGGADHRGTVGKLAPGLFAQEGRCWRIVYAEPSRPPDTLHDVGGVGWPMEVPKWLDEGVVVRTARRRAAWARRVRELSSNSSHATLFPT